MFASADLSKRSWLDTPTVKEGKAKKTSVAAKIKWPMFNEMFLIEYDPFWKDYWMRASKGKFPNGFSFNGKDLFYTYRNKCTRVVVNNNYSDMCQVIKAMMQEHANIYSPLDLKRINNIRSIDDTSNVIENWSKCNPSQKDNLIAYYVLQLSSEYNLNIKERDELDQTINVGVNIGAFNKDTIFINNNKVEYIEGLDWDADKNKFFINIEKSPFKIKKPANNTSKKADPYCFLAKWEKINKSKIKKKINDMDINNINTSMSSCYPEE